MHFMLVRAAREGLSLSEYVLRLIGVHAAKPTVHEVLDRPRTGWSRGTRDDVLQALDEGRQERDVKVDRMVSERGGR